MSLQPDAPVEPPWSTEVEAEQVYTNVLKVNGGPFDVMLIFGHMQPSPGAPASETPSVNEVVRVSMSWGHLKSMVPLLARMVAEYESKVGQIPAPGFEDLWRG